MKALLVDGKIYTETLLRHEQVLEVEYEGVAIGTATVVTFRAEPRTCHCGWQLNSKVIVSLDWDHVGVTLDYEWQRSP